MTQNMGDTAKDMDGTGKTRKKSKKPRTGDNKDLMSVSSKASKVSSLKRK